MFGYVIANADSLTDEEKARYKAVYCGLCRSLGERHGLRGRLTLNYDMTFLILLLNSMYEPEETQHCESIRFQSTRAARARLPTMLPT